MSEGRSRETWEHTSAVLAMIVNVNRLKKTSLKFTPLDFDPYAAEKRRWAEGQPVIAMGSIGILKTVFVDSRSK